MMLCFVSLALHCNLQDAITFEGCIKQAAHANACKHAVVRRVCSMISMLARPLLQFTDYRFWPSAPVLCVHMQQLKRHCHLAAALAGGTQLLCCFKVQVFFMLGCALNVTI